MTTLRVFEAFSGVGAQHMAFRNIEADYEVIGTSDWDINATLSYNAIHTKNPIDFAADLDVDDMRDYLEQLSVSSDGKEPLTRVKINRLNEKKVREVYNAFKNAKNLGSIVSIDPKDVPDHDLFTYSFPCQAISLAGKQAGLEKDSGTSSSLLWECQKIIEAKHPKFLLMENVKNLVGKKFKPFFDEWVEYLESQGYRTYWKVMNAKNYGTPQNRERVFALSVRDDVKGEYEFPEEYELTKRLKDVLEKKVDEKFYISQDKVDQLIANLDGKVDTSKQVIGTCHPRNDLSFATRDRVYNEEKNAPTLSATMYKDAPKVLVHEETNRILRVGNVNPSGNGMNGEVVHEDGLAPTVTTNKGEGSKVLQVGNIVTTGNWDNPQRGRIYSSDGISPSLNTVGGGGLEPKILIKNATKQGYTEAVDGDAVDLAYPNSSTRRGRVQKGLSHTIQTADTIGVVELENNPVIIDDTMGFDGKPRVYDEYAPSLRAERSGLKTLESKEEFGRMGKQAVDTYNEKQPGAYSTINPFNKSVSSEDGISPTITTRPEGFKTAITAVVPSDVELPAIAASRGRYNDNGEIEQKLEVNKDNLSNTITTVTKDNLAIESQFRIRKLTPLECWRLMAFSDEDFYKAQAIHSNSTLYKQAGNSIVVTCLEGIFSQLMTLHNNQTHNEELHNETHNELHNEIYAYTLQEEEVQDKQKDKEEVIKMTEVKRPNKRIVVLDFETTGFSSIANEVTEVGAVTIDGKTGEVTNVFDSLINVEGNIPSKIVELTGITKELTNTHGLPFEVVKGYLQSICKDAIVVAHNVQFDFSFLKDQFDIEPSFYYDTLTISRDLYPNEKSHKLGDICDRANIGLVGAHRALNDVHATVALLNKQLNTPGVAQKYINVISSARGVKFKPENTREII